MIGFEFSVLMVLSLVFAGGTVVHAVQAVLPQIAGLRQALEQCPEILEVRFTVRETVVRYDDGKVVPLRPRAAIKFRQPLPTRAAA
jgi:hypothetical protein